MSFEKKKNIYIYFIYINIYIYIYIYIYNGFWKKNLFVNEVVNTRKYNRNYTKEYKMY